MTPENKKKLWNEILNAGDYLKDKLPDHPNHPKGRNSYAHVSLEIKNKFNMSYKDLPDDQYNRVLDFLNFLKKNPNQENSFFDFLRVKTIQKKQQTSLK